MSMKLRIGTRGSALALWQAEYVESALKRIYPNLETERIIIKTEGDRDRKSSLTQIGGQGVFTKTIEQALLQERIDVAVHSLKDLPSTMSDGLTIAAVPPRAPVEDVLISRDGKTLDEMPQGAKIATGSIRRRCQLLALRPDLQMADLRGNIHTRLRKLHEQNLDGIIMARAALERLGIRDVPYQIFAPEVMIPSVGQAAIGVQIRSDDLSVGRLVAALNDQATYQCVMAERTVLRELDTGCQFPMGAYGKITDGQMHLTAFVGSVDGKQIIRATEVGQPTRFKELGHRLAQKLLQAGAASLLKDFRDGNVAK